MNGINDGNSMNVSNSMICHNSYLPPMYLNRQRADLIADVPAGRASAQRQTDDLSAVSEWPSFASSAEREDVIIIGATASRPEDPGLL